MERLVQPVKATSPAGNSNAAGGERRYAASSLWTILTAAITEVLFLNLANLTEGSLMILNAGVPEARRLVVGVVTLVSCGRQGRKSPVAFKHVQGRNCRIDTAGNPLQGGASGAR